ncbi:DMT family transporter [Rhizobium sp. SSA_523]|uniref:DMT family transporter n=1 Tax=Rhizobium sp. SSA_523 TaxID=2952477 RepID=UPI0020912EEB|nr:DMT family transporter [Rhizobium sp. SSA_523]MCO5730825.1 DMT family transporter [Rhizobium sp. SSA_523]WKC24353.1 DMT family transporter [Rhizobium sp. SSA_523]
MTGKTRGLVFALAAVTIFAGQDAISKHLATHYPPIFITMIRYWVFGIFVILLSARSKGGIAGAARSARPLLQILRGLILVTQIVMAITSFALVGLSHTQSIFAATPLFVAALSVPLLGERVGWRRWTAIALGLFGVLLIINPTTASLDIKLLLPVAGSAVFALYAITTRLAGRTDSSETSFFYTGVAGAIAISFVGPFFWTSLAAQDWIWMAALCCTGISGHYLLIRAYDLVDAVTVQQIGYVQVVLVCILGVAIYGELITANMVVGALLVIGAGLFTIWRESRSSRRQQL